MLLQKTITRERVVRIPYEKIGEARDDLRSLHDPRSLSHNDGYYVKILEKKWGMSVSDLELLVGRPVYDSEPRWEYPE